MPQTVRNYYEILGVTRESTAEEIKKSFRQLARKYHPDVNPGNDTAEETFKDINEAYDVLSDETKKAEYDQLIFGKAKRRVPLTQRNNGNVATNNNSRTPFDTWTVKDFNSASTKRPKVMSSTTVRRDVEAKLTLPLEKAYQGGKERIRLEDGRSLEVDMPPFMVNGQRIRLKGQGINQGDLYLKITVAQHYFFEVQGKDIFCQIPLTPSEAVLGGAVEVPTLDGLVKMMVPQGVRTGQRLRLANKGYPNPQGSNERGDQLVEIKILTPPQPSPEEIELYQQLRQIETFKPRKNIKIE
jgi:curved DNA-binding protein